MKPRYIFFSDLLYVLKFACCRIVTLTVRSPGLPQFGQNINYESCGLKLVIPHEDITSDNFLVYQLH